MTTFETFSKIKKPTNYSPLRTINQIIMNRFFIKSASLFFILLWSCSPKVEAPQPFGAIPTKSQLDWHAMEYFSLVCYGLNTYTEQEWAYGDVDPQLFNPSNLDTDQWAKTASEAGMKGMILVAKHHDGFCLWPSKYTDYSVKSTPWKNGQGDVLGDLSKSCKKYGLKLGVYLSPWDRNHADYGRPEYVTYYHRQLEELLTEYGDVFEFWIDGANGGTGYYGGAHGTRSIDRRHYYGYDSIFAIVKKHQPGAVIFSDVGPGVRWVGNEGGIAGETNWNTINTGGMFPGETSPEFHRKLGVGDAGGAQWIPAEANTTLLWPKAWYYHTGHQPRSLENLMELYYTSIGRGSPLNLGLAIAPDGQLREVDVEALRSFKKQLELEFSDNKVATATITASDYRGNNRRFAPDKTVDADHTDTYWATNDSVQQADIIFEWKEEVSINRLVLQEHLALGQRVNEFEVLAQKNGKYEQIAKGTTVGYKRAIRFETVKTNRLRIVFNTDAPCLTISNIGIYRAPALLSDPVGQFDTKGYLKFEPIEGANIYYALGNAPEASDFTRYTAPVHLPLGGTLHQFAKNQQTGNRTNSVITRLGIAKSGWSIKVPGQNQASEMIDHDEKTVSILKKTRDGKKSVVIDLGKIYPLDAFGYLPRQDGKKDGIIDHCAFYTSKDGVNWGAPVFEGPFDNIANNPVKQIKPFQSGVHQARYVKLVAKSTLGNEAVISIAELDVFHKMSEFEY